MKVCTLLTCCLFSMVPAFAAKMPGPTHRTPAVPQGPKIRVLLAKDATSALLEVKGNYRVVRKDNGSPLSFGGTGKRFVIHALQDGLRWGEEYPDVYQISVIPNSPDTTLFVNGIQYKGSVSIYHVHNNRITVVNEVPIEDYVKSVMTLQFSSPVSQEAMRALAIAARTEAYGHVLNGSQSKRPWDVRAGDSGYYGFGVSRQKNGVEDAVDWTRFMVMESVKSEALLQEVQLVPSEVEELAQNGYDAQKILKASYPQAKFGVTIDPNEVAIR